MPEVLFRLFELLPQFYVLRAQTGQLFIVPHGMRVSFRLLERRKLYSQTPVLLLEVVGFAPQLFALLLRCTGATQERDLAYDEGVVEFCDAFLRDFELCEGGVACTS